MKKSELRKLIKEELLSEKKLSNKYPELKKIAEKIADDTSEAINKEVKTVQSKMPYKEQ